jgi:hypothetical protein
MPDITAIGGALNAFNAMKNIAQAMIGLRDAQAFNAKLIEFNGALIEAQTRVFAVNEERTTLIERVHELEARIAEIEGWKAEKNRYELKEMARQNFAYVLKPEAQGSEPSHWLCPHCYQNVKKSILQGLDSAAFGWSHTCPSCKLEVQG